MRWTRKYIGKEEIKTHFAWLPVTAQFNMDQDWEYPTDAGQTRWLERVTYRRTWSMSGWSNLEFLDADKEATDV